MKQLLLVALLAVGGGASAWGQAPDLSPLPIDSATQRITITQTVEVPGGTKADLYSRAREWTTTAFAPSKVTLEMDDREVGKIIARYGAPLRLASGVGVGVDMMLWRTVRVEMKDGKYRYTATGFALGAPTMPEANARPAEQYLKASSFNYQKDGTPKKMAGSIISSIREGIAQNAASLRAAMIKPAGKDW